jgi:hypothetical protein
MEVIGKIKVIGSIQQVTDSYKKRELVVTTAEQYPQHILIEFGQDKCDLLNNYAIGDEVKVGINLRGREWVNPEGVSKYFNSVQGWKISKDAVDQQNNQQQINNTPVNNAEIVQQSEQESEDASDLPF